MLPPKGHEANPTELFQAVVQQNVRELQALIGRRAEKYGPETILEAQIAMSEVFGRLHFNTAAFCRVVKMPRRLALLAATLRFSPAVNCWRKGKNRGLKKSHKVENRIEKGNCFHHVLNVLFRDFETCFLICSRLLLSLAVI